MDDGTQTTQDAQSPTKKLSSYQEELAAMEGVADVLNPLDEEARGRVVRWAIDRYRLFYDRHPGRSY